MTNDYKLQLYFDHFKDRLSAKQQKEWDLLQQKPDHSTEYRSYVQLFEGFEAMAMDLLINNSKDWQQMAALFEEEKSEDLTAGFEALQMEEMTKKLSAWQQEKPGNVSQGKVRRLSIRSIISIAAMVLVAGTIGIWLFQSGGDVRQFNTYYASLPIPQTRASADGTAFDQGIQALTDGNNREAIEQLQLAVQQNPTPESRFWLGHALVQSKNYKAAIAEFELVADEDQSIYREMAQWNAMLCLWRSEGDFQNALSEMLNAPNHSFHEQAQKFRDQLN